MSQRRGEKTIPGTSPRDGISEENFVNEREPRGMEREKGGNGVCVCVCCGSAQTHTCQDWPPDVVSPSLQHSS